MNNFPRLWDSLINSETGMPAVVNSVQRVMDSRFHAETESVHEEFELVYIQQADKGGFEIDGTFVSVRANDLILIKPGVPHKIRIESNHPFQFLALKFSFSKNIGQQYAGISVNDFLSFISESSESCSYFTISNIYCTNIASLMRQIIHEDKSPDRESEFMQSLLTMELFVWLSRSLRAQWETTLLSKGHKMQEMLEEARNFIDENYNSDISLSEIAGYVYISTSHFARAFKKYYDISPIQYLLKVRVEKACQYLEETNMKVGEIASNVGFSAQQRFNDIFRKHTGLSPGEYRKQFKESILNKNE